jgi:cell division protein FtsN
MVSTGPYTIQVGSYAFEASKATPEAKLKDLGLTDYHYVDRAQRVHLYDVVAGKGLDKTQAESLLKSLAGLKFVPRLEPQGDRYQVIAYSYGNRADAERAQAKIEKAGLGKVFISSYSKTMTLHQLRVGGFPSSLAAQATLPTLRQAGFHPLIVRER